MSNSRIFNIIRREYGGHGSRKFKITISEDETRIYIPNGLINKEEADFLIEYATNNSDKIFSATNRTARWTFQPRKKVPIENQNISFSECSEFSFVCSKGLGTETYFSFDKDGNLLNEKQTKSKKEGN